MGKRFVLVCLILISPIAGYADDYERECEAKGGTLQGRGCHCPSGEFIYPFTEKCPERHLSDLAQRLSESGFLEAACIQEVVLGDASESIPDLSECPFLKRREDLSFLKENWGLELTGADLLRDHPAVKGASYTQGLAIIDTGLTTRGNPEAGEALDRSSPNEDFHGHGTHVAGISASQKYGVNPLLPLKAFPVEEARTSALIKFFGETGLSQESLLNQLNEAISDPSISVINLSMSASEDPPLQTLLEEAMAKGKWIVYAAGNEGAVASHGTTGWQQLKTNPNLFSVGALSYFGTPSTFSNFGSMVDWYAPGSEIESLSGRYHPSLENPETSLSLSGTSMAAPHFSAILATLKNIYPNLTIEEARQILEMTSIVRGDHPTVKQVNAYHAVELLYRAKSCLESKSRGDCLTEAEEKIKASLASPSAPPSKPEGEACADWENYYRELKKGYFLSNGDPRFSNLLRGFFRRTPRWAENIYFSSPSQMKPMLEYRYLNPQPSAVQAEYQYALRFLRGELETVPETLGSLSLLQEKLERLLPTEENMETYLSMCEGGLYDGSPLCIGYIYNAPKAFRLAIAKKLIENNRPLYSPDVAWNVKLFETEEEKELYRKLLSLSVQGWDRGKSFGNARALSVRMSDLSLEDRKKLILAFKKAVENGEVVMPMVSFGGTPEELYLYLLSWGPPEVVRGHEDQIRAYFIPHRHEGEPPAYPALGDFRYEIRRFEAGFGEREKILDTFQKLLRLHDDTRPIHLDRLQEFGDNATNSAPLLRAIEDPEIARGVSRVLSDPKNFERFQTGFTFTHGPDILSSLLNKIPTEEASLLLSAMTAILPRGSTQFDLSRGDHFYDFLKLNETHVAVQPYLERIKSSQEDPFWKSVRLAYLKDRMREAQAPLPEAQEFLEEGEGERSERLFNIPSRLIAQDEELLRVYQEELSHPEVIPRGEYFLETVAYAKSEADFRVLSEPVSRELSTVWKRTKRFPSYEAEKLARTYVTYAGSNPEAMNMVLDQVNLMLDDDTFLSQAAEVREDPYVDRQDEGITSFVSIVARSKAGARYLKEHPELSHKLARRIVSQAKRERNLLFPRGFIPVSLATELRKSLPSARKLNQLDDERDIPNWIFNVLRSDPESLDRALSYVDNVKFKDEFRDAIVALVWREPRLAERVLRKTRDRELIAKIKEIQGI